MRPLLLSAGSRGDFEPLFALAAELDYSLLFCQRDYVQLAPPKCKSMPLPFELADFMPLFAQAMADAENDQHIFEMQWRGLGLAMGSVVMPAFDEILAVAQRERIDIVLSTTLTWPVACIVADKMDVPLVMLTLQPDLASTYVPHGNIAPVEAAAAFDALRRDAAVSDPKNKESYERLHRTAVHKYLPVMNRKREQLGLPAITEQYARDLLDGKTDVPTIIGLSTNLVPTPPDYNKNVHVVGSLAAGYTPSAYVPEEAHRELCEFLESGASPIVVSFGSMPCKNSAALTRAVLTGLRDADAERVVLLPGRAGLDVAALDSDDELRVWCEGRVLTAQNVQFSYLLPRARVLVCHGGAGAVGAALYAGTPLVVVPVAFDQPFHAESVSKLGVGTKLPAGLDALTAQDLAAAAREAMTDSVRERAEQVGVKERAAVRATEHVKMVLRDLLR